jgi:transglutaminase-like putative cysteine protease
MGASVTRGGRALALVALAVVLLPGMARAVGSGPVLHEMVPPDPHEDLALEVALDGDLPAALDTRSGLVTAPDPRRPIPPGESPYGGGSNATTDTFAPDRNTKRPEVEGYDEPFTPSTAPFKRLEAFDAVDDHYQLFVRDQRLREVLLSSAVASDGTEEQFFADMVVNVGPGKRSRIPSVGPGARILRARLGIGSQDLTFHVLKDGADNWFVETAAASVTTPQRARLVMELTVARGSFGGDFGNPRWSDLPRPPDLPEGVLRAAREVEAHIGVSRDLSPREATGKLVNYFRGFTDSEDPPRGRGDIYLDLALSKKGVCRHRAFAFMVTANALGLPTRMVLNEAHAWVEVNDGTLWRRIDLGGAGHMTTPASNLVPERTVFQPPPDVFGWPQGSERGDDMVQDARQRGRMMPSGQPGNGSSSGGGSGNGSSAGAAGEGGDGADPSSSTPSNLGAPLGSAGTSPSDNPRDERPPSVLTVTSVDGGDAHRGSPLHVAGEVRADGEPCANVVVEVLLKGSNGRLVLLGSLATGEKGTYSGGIVVPGTVPLGDYDVVVRTPGDAKCGRGASL